LAYLSKFIIPDLLSCDGRLDTQQPIHDCGCANSPTGFYNISLPV